jgi:hypothetical protein
MSGSCKMAGKAKLFNLVKKLGCEIDFDKDYIGVMAPKGKVFGDHQHYSGYGVGREEGKTKTDAYRDLIDELASIRDCEDPQCNDGCAEFNKTRKDK